MASITDHVIKLQELTQKNLDILQALNDSFFTNQNHLSVKIGDNQYAIPSFITLENKLNSLTANFENLVHAPETGEAFFNFDGNSRSINVRSYTTTPNSLVLPPVTEFFIDKNDIFKDFLTPSPYIHIDVKELPNDTTQVMVKKIIPISQELKDLFHSQLNDEVGGKTITKVSVQYKYSDLFKILSLYQQDIDYIEYDKKIDLPIRKNIGEGVYVVEEIIEDVVDENLDNFLTIKFRSDIQDPTIMSSMKYRLFDETIERMLKVGDQLVTFEGNAKLEIIEIRPNNNTIVVKVLHGDFLNLVPANTNNLNNISSLSKLRFFSPIDFNDDKYVKIPLEEDKYVYVAIAPLNSRMNIQSSWGTGLMLDAHSLLNDKTDFKSYYNQNVRNIGDILSEITSMMSNPLTRYTEEEFNEMTNYKPVINTDDLLVTKINSHLDQSASVQNIRSLYSQKKTLQTQLQDVVSEINSLNDTLASISFDDTTGRRNIYTSQISELNTRRNELSTSISKIIDEISISANNSEVPIENAKYRIRGFFDIQNIKWKDYITGIRVRYRYKNVNAEQNTALTINDKFTFSDWNEMGCSDRTRIPEYTNGVYQSKIEQLNDNANEPSFNQIDIPISQGETVDIQLKLVYDFGAPFVQTSSDWSEPINMVFPDEFLKDIKILDIISENNNDIETHRFNNIIKEEGIPEHIGDKITDQDITYFHKPENIASGFYTTERRIIPLKDKLEELNNLLIQLNDEIYGTNSEDLKISLKQGLSQVVLTPFVDNKIFTEGYDTITSNNSKSNGSYEYNSKTHLVTTIYNLSLLNDSNHTVKLYSMFPGDRGTKLYSLINYKFDKSSYGADKDKNENENHGVWYEHPEGQTLQGGNQFLYFRIKDVNNGVSLYASGDQSGSNQLSLDSDKYKYTSTSEPTSELENTSMWLYPKLTKTYGLCLDSNIIGSHIIIKPGEEFVIPIVVEFYIGSEGQPNEISKTMSFDILPSLYKDPISYKFTVVAKKQNTIQDQLILSSQQNTVGTKYNIIYR